MRHIIAYFWMILILLTSLPAIAQENVEAKDLLDRTASLLKKGGIEASFTMTPYRQGIPEAPVRGHICIDGEKFRMEMPDMITWFDGRTQWTYLTANEEVNISNPTREELQNINPLWLISLYEHGYHCMIGKTTSSTNEVTLTAEDPEQLIAHVILTIDKQNGMPTVIKLKEKGRDYTVINIGNLKQGQKWKKEFFVFDAKQYPDAELIDLR